MNQGGKGEWDMRVCSTDACVRAIAHRKKREGCTESEREKEREKGG